MKLPLLEYVAQLFRYVRLEKTLIIACQHILKTNYEMFLKFFDKGLDPKNVFILGKCYSTDKKALHLFVKKGVHVHYFSEAFDSHRSYDEEYKRYVHEFLLGILRKAPLQQYERVILIDDGGFLIDSANQLLNNCKNVMAIEQTSSGYEKIKNLKLRSPVINVARSYAKLIYESPSIAEQFVQTLRYELKNYKKYAKNILVLGQGPIGIEIANSLRKKYNVYVYDPLSVKSNFETFEELKKEIKRFDVIIGCTGKNSLPLSVYTLLKSGVILASASSSDREFTAPRLRMLAERYCDCHLNLEIRDVTLLNSGFPLTFTKYNLGLEMKKIQLTRALIFAALCLGYVKKYPLCLIDLDYPLQELLIKRFQELFS